jgi:hypothetical protein
MSNQNASLEPRLTFGGRKERGYQNANDPLAVHVYVPGLIS